MRNQERSGLSSRQGAAPRCCDHPDCGEAGEYRAPKSRDRLDDYHWFCLDHVREYNRAWNYYAGMSQEEIEFETRRDTTWQRPTWPLGMRVGGYRRFAKGDSGLHDGFGVFAGGDGRESRHETGCRAAGFHPASHEARALAVIDLDPPLTLTHLKARYKELVKLHHPDANGGDKLAEERLKDINEAYATLKKVLTD